MQDKGNFHGYPQNIQMVPQGANHQPQIPVSSNQEGSFDQSNPYGNVPPAVVQQGVIYQAVPVHPQMAMYPNSGYPAPGYPSHPQAAQYVNYPVSNQMFVTSDQIHLMNPYNQVFMIETKIKTGYCCYTCLVYTGLIFTILGILGSISAPSNPSTNFLNILISIAMIVGYVLAIKAKSTFDTKKQHQAYIIFCVVTVVRFLVSLLFFNQIVRATAASMYLEIDRSHGHNDPNLTSRDIDDAAVGAAMFGILLALLFDLLLVYYAHALRKLMKERDQILINLNSANRIV